MFPADPLPKRQRQLEPVVHKIKTVTLGNVWHPSIYSVSHILALRIISFMPDNQITIWQVSPEPRGSLVLAHNILSTDVAFSCTAANQKSAERRDANEGGPGSVAITVMCVRAC